VAVDKGAIDDGHVLVLPIEHFPNSLGVPDSTYAEMERYLSALQSCYAAQASRAKFSWSADSNPCCSPKPFSRDVITATYQRSGAQCSCCQAAVPLS
jgi:Protein similar to CwfJ C-terminus 1